MNLLMLTAPPAAQSVSGQAMLLPLSITAAVRENAKEDVCVLQLATRGSELIKTVALSVLQCCTRSSSLNVHRSRVATVSKRMTAGACCGRRTGTGSCNETLQSARRR